MGCFVVTIGFDDIVGALDSWNGLLDHTQHTQFGIARLAKNLELKLARLR